MAGRRAWWALLLSGGIPTVSAAQPVRAECCARMPAGVSVAAPSVAAVAAVQPPLLRPRGSVGLASPDSLRVVRPMSGAERAVVALAATLSGVSWGLGGAAAGGAVGIAACLQRSGDDALDRVRGCRAAERWLAAGGMLGTLAGAASGANFAARRLGCSAPESRRRAWGGAVLGTLVAAVPAVAYAAADDPSPLLGAAVVLAVPALQIGGAARQAGHCRLPVPILR